MTIRAAAAALAVVLMAGCGSSHQPHASAPAPQATRAVPAGASRALVGPTAVAFDRAGNAWVACQESVQLVDIPSADLERGGPARPALTLTVPINGEAPLNDLAFDASGRLWAANYGGSVVAYTPAQLRRGGTLAPAVVLHGAALPQPTGLTFTSSGELVVVNSAGPVVVFSPGDLARSGSPAPIATVPDPDAHLETARFDHAGRLWVTSYANAQARGYQRDAGGWRQVGILRLPASKAAIGIAFGPDRRGWIADWSGSAVYGFPAGALTADPVTSLTGALLSQPHGATFDSKGRLWVADPGSESLQRFDAAQLARGGDVLPAAVIGGS